jgi:hypothetical protein
VGARALLVVPRTRLPAALLLVLLGALQQLLPLELLLRRALLLWHRGAV